MDAKNSDEEQARARRAKPTGSRKKRKEEDCFPIEAARATILRCEGESLK
jgi:hypothetical protein